MAIKDFYPWTDNPTESGIAECNTDTLNDCLMHLKYQNGSSLPLFTPLWLDHEIDDMSYLRADTFSWQPGATYSVAYNELETEYTDVDSTTETVDGITYKLTPKGYKIAAPDQEQAILNKYTITGQAWYYILDTENVRFKLPRTKYGFTGLRTVVGTDVKSGMPEMIQKGAHTHTRGTMNITGTAGKFNVFQNTSSGALSITNELESDTRHDWGGHVSKVTLDASKSWTGETSLNGLHYHSFANTETTDTVQTPATQMYLYFYVGNFSKTAVENTAGLNTEVFNNKADTNLANLDEAGESHFDTRYLNQDEVAYGITELPNRIKWKLENNVFTLQAGSVVLVPYGTKDLTEQLPIGSSFIHENWKVVDTQFDSGDTPRFFVWATNLEDITSTKETTNKYKLLLTVEFATNSIARASTADVSSNTPTDSTNPTKNGLFYNAYSNYCYYFRTAGENSQNMSLPFGISESTGTNVFDKVNQIFNGIGFIGSTIFVDKGIKAKVAYGFENGKRISRQLVTNNVQLRYNALSSQNTIVLYLADDDGYAIGLGSGFNSCESIYQKNIQYSYWYINNKNQTFVYNNETAQNLVPISKFSVENSNVNTLTPFSTNHLVGYDEFIENSFGKWHGTGLELQSRTAISSTTSNTYDLSSFIPKDGNNYEILLDITVNAPKANFGKFVVATASSSIQANTFVGRVACMDANYANITQVVTYFPIGADRKLTISGKYSSIAGTYSLYARGYRKIR